VVKEGDQIVGATVYFDSMSSEDIERLLTNVGHHTVGLKLQRKGDHSPQPEMTWSHDVFHLKSPDVVLSGDDEEYRRIYTKKIKGPRLKSEEFLETQTRTITVTRKVTAYTVDVSGSKGTKEIDISSPEYKIKIPKHEITEISKTSIETEKGKTVIKIPSADISGRTFEIGKEIHLETKGSGVSVTGGIQSTSNSSVYSQVTNAGTFGFHGINSDGNISISSKDSPSFSGPKYQSYEQHIDVKGSVYEATQKDQLRSLHDSETSSIDMMKGSLLKGDEADRAGKSTINTDFASMDKTFGISKGGFQSSTIMLKETRFDMQKPGGFTVEQSDIGVKVPKTDINISAQKSKSDISLSPVYRRELSGDQMVKSYPESNRGISVQSTEIFLPGQRKDTGDRGVDVVAPILDVKISQMDIDSTEVKSQMPSIKVPLSVSGKEEAAGDTDLKLQGPATDINVSSPDIQAATLQIDGKNQSAGIKLVFIV
ncbi:neuroblast differentiation-associated protein AHNAK-like, partial [Xenopus laevis]|uniref:Neuroblast differentiation-associated protein AHNAK-like n=1 Tax=Xenopus laevis TaxID=8355 RepID=A0A8J1MSZ4_XENLA